MTSREQFEEWATNAGFIVTTKNDGYLYPATNSAWQAWQASREAIEITLPEVYGEKYTPSSITMDGFDFEQYLQDLYAAIELEGIKVKK
jgi:hypothetical protein